MRILIHGFYGAGNAGDDSILEAVIGRVRQALDPTQIVVSCYAQRIPVGQGDETVRSVNGRDCQALYEEIKAADLVVVGGGGLFQDYHGFDIRSILGKTLGAGFGNTAVGYYGLPIILAGLLDKPAVLYAIGAGPFRTKEAARVGAWLAEGATAITVRDKGSADLLKSLGVTNPIVTADPAVGLKPPKTAPDLGELGDWLGRPGSGLKVGINMRTWPFGQGGTAQAEEAVGALADHLVAKHGARIVYLPFNQSPAELDLSSRAAARAGEERTRILPYSGSVPELLAILGKLDLVVGMRLHAAILAVVAGTTPVGLSYDPKVASFFRELGADRLCLDLNTVTGETLKNKVDAAIKILPACRARVKKGLHALELREIVNGIVLQRTAAVGHNRLPRKQLRGGKE